MGGQVYDVVVSMIMCLFVLVSSVCFLCYVFVVCMLLLCVGDELLFVELLLFKWINRSVGVYSQAQQDLELARRIISRVSER